MTRSPTSWGWHPSSRAAEPAVGDIAGNCLLGEARARVANRPERPHFGIRHCLSVSDLGLEAPGMELAGSDYVLGRGGERSACSSSFFLEESWHLSTARGWGPPGPVSTPPGPVSTPPRDRPVGSGGPGRSQHCRDLVSLAPRTQVQKNSLTRWEPSEKAWHGRTLAGHPGGDRDAPWPFEAHGPGRVSCLWPAGSSLGRRHCSRVRGPRCHLCHSWRPESSPASGAGTRVTGGDRG